MNFFHKWEENYDNILKKKLEFFNIKEFNMNFLAQKKKIHI